MGTAFIMLRRLLTVPFIVLFVGLFVVALAAFRINGTLLQPSFYTGALQELDVYNFLYDDALSAALTDAGVSVEDVALGITLTNEEIVGYVERVLPPDWLQRQVEQVVEQAVPYLTGQRDEFSVTVRLDDRLAEAVLVVEEIILEAALYEFVIEEVIRPRLETSGTLADLPYGLSLTSDQIVEGVREVLPEEWLVASIEEVLDEVTPYATGERDDFRILISLQDRAQAALVVLERWLQQGLEGGTYDYLLQEQVAPTIQQELGAETEVFMGLTLTLTEEEIIDAVSQVLPPEWISDRVTDAFEALGPYLTGETDAFVIEIPLRGRMELAAQFLVGLVDTKIEELFASLPSVPWRSLPPWSSPRA